LEEAGVDSQGELLLHPPDDAVLLLREGRQGFTMRHVPSIYLTPDSMGEMLQTNASEMEEGQLALEAQREVLQAALDLVNETEVKAAEVEARVKSERLRVEESIGIAHQFRRAMATPTKPRGEQEGFSSPNTSRRVQIRRENQDKRDGGFEHLELVEEGGASDSSMGREGRRKASSGGDHSPVHQYSSVLDNVELLRLEEARGAFPNASRSRSVDSDRASGAKSQSRPASADVWAEEAVPLPSELAPISGMGTPRARALKARGALPGRGLPREQPAPGFAPPYRNDSEVKLEDLETDEEGEDVLVDV